MAHYEYQGQHYELPDGLDNVAALNKIKTYLKQPTNTSQTAPPDDWEAPYQKYVADWNHEQTKPLIPGEPRSTKPLLSKEDWRSTKDSEWLKNMGGAAVAGVEQGLNLLGGTGGAIVAPLAAGTKWVSNKLMGQPGQFERDYSDLFNAAASTGTQLVDATGFDNKGRTRVNQAVGNVVNNLLLPMAGHGQVSPIPEVVAKPINTPKRTSTDAVPKETAGTKLAAEFAKKNTPTPQDLGTQLAQDRYSNDRTVERLQHTLDKQNNQLPPISVDAQGRAWTGDDIPVKRQWDAQVAIEERQAALERQMQLNVEEQRRQQLQGPTASELEAQPTGYEAWAEGQRQAANQRLPGNNDPLELGPSVLRKAEQYPDVNDFPDILQEAPYQYEGGIDWPTAEQKALPITVADILGSRGMPKPDPFNRVSPQQTANRILSREPNTPENTQARTDMAREAHDTFGQTGGMGKNQRGAINLQAIKEGFDKLLRGETSSEDYVRTFYGAFHQSDLESQLADLKDPKARYTLALMSPDEFHNLASRRGANAYTYGADMKRESIRDGLKFNKEGLRDIPQLWIRTNPQGVAEVTGHEGRHRMDVFREMGVEKVPVIIQHDMMRWGETPSDQFPKKIKPEDDSLLSRGKGRPIQKFPQVLNKGLSRGQRGAFDWGDSKTNKFLENLDPFSKKARFGKIVKHTTNLYNQIKDSFPDIAKYIKRRDVQELINEYVESKYADDSIEFWQEKLAGTTRDEDPTIGGQLQKIGKNTWTGQAKGPKDLLPLTLPKNFEKQANQFAAVIDKMRENFVEGRLPPEPMHPEPNEFQWPTGKDPLFHEERMKNQEYARKYEQFKKDVEHYNTTIDQLHNEFADKYGFNPSGFYPSEYRKPIDAVWDLIFGVADKIYLDEQNAITQYGLNGFKNSQRGALDIDSIVKGLQKLSHKSVDFLDKRERILMSAVGDNSFILHPGDPAKAIESALAEGKDGKGWALTQSGLGMYAEKNNSALARYVARSLSYANNIFVKSNKDFIDPVERSLRHISRDKQTMIDLNEIMKVEQQARRRATPEELANSGLNEKAIQAYTNLRKAMDEAIARANAAREKLGLDPVTPEQAYYSSMQQGNWQLVGYALDKEGNPTVLSHYSRVLTRGEGNKAIAWINKNRPEVVKTKLEYVPINDLKGIPRDVFGTYKAMADIFKDTPMEQQMHEMMQQATTEQAFNERGFSKHFLTKGNIPGFIGDRPWLDPYENAKAGMKAQIQYLKDANRWIPLQDALAGIKEVISNRELQEKQPNNIAMSRAYMVNALGGTKSWFDGLSHDFSRAAGVSPGQARKYIADLKNLTYLQLIGGSTGYSIATPLQVLVLGPAYHVKEGAIPFKEYLPIYGRTLTDSWQILMSHEIGNLTGKDISNVSLTKLSPLAREAMRYMEDNNVISRNWFDEHAELGTHPVIELANKTGGMTITGPEKIARTLTFMSFVHHLKAQGKLSGLELFKRADELTNHTLTNFDRNARPLIVDKMGNIGELAYTFKGPIFQYYNSLIGFAKLGKETGNWKPLGTALLMTGLLGGVINLPGVQEYDSTSNMLKKLISYVHPEWAKTAEDVIPNVKEFALKHLPDAVTYGTVSAATNTQMASRFSTQVIDPSRPLDNFAPVAQEVKEQLALLNNIPILGNPSRTSMAEGIWQNMPPLIKGQMEYNNWFDAFKVPGKRPDGTQGAYNPNNLKDRSDTYQRTQADWNRRAAGLTSLDEARFKDARYATTQHSQRVKIAQDSALENLVDKIVMQKSTNDQTYKKDIRKYAIAYFENEGDANTFQSELDKRLIKAFTTPEERNAMRANSIHEVMNIKRMLEMNRGKYAN